MDCRDYQTNGLEQIECEREGYIHEKEKEEEPVKNVDLEEDWWDKYLKWRNG